MLVMSDTSLTFTHAPYQQHHQHQHPSLIDLKVCSILDNFNVTNPSIERDSVMISLLSPGTLSMNSFFLLFLHVFVRKSHTRDL